MINFWKFVNTLLDTKGSNYVCNFVRGFSNYKDVIVRTLQDIHRDILVYRVREPP